MPGFRKGKVPRQIVLQRLGRAEVLDETLREHLSRWWSRPSRPPTSCRRASRGRSGGAARGGRAVPLHRDRARCGRTAASPSRCCSRRRAPTPRAGRGRRRRARAAAHRRRAAPGCRRPRGRRGRLRRGGCQRRGGRRPVDGLRARGLFVQLGSGRLLEPLERAVIGLHPGQSATAEIPFGDDYHDPALAGHTATATVELRAIRERDDRPFDDELAATASEFGTVTDLRAAVEASSGRAARGRGHGPLPHRGPARPRPSRAGRPARRAGARPGGRPARLLRPRARAPRRRSPDLHADDGQSPASSCVGSSRATPSSRCARSSASRRSPTASRSRSTTTACASSSPRRPRARTAPIAWWRT